MGGNTSKVPEIILSISWKGVQFADASTKVRRERGTERGGGVGERGRMEREREEGRERETKIEREGGEREREGGKERLR